MTIAGFSLLAAALYALRSSHRLLFGLIDVVFGILILAIAANSYYAAEAREFIPIVGGGVFRQPPEGLLHIRSTSVSWFQMAAAIYISVRGSTTWVKACAVLRTPSGIVYGVVYFLTRGGKCQAGQSSRDNGTKGYTHGGNE